MLRILTIILLLLSFSHGIHAQTKVWLDRSHVEVGEKVRLCYSFNNGERIGEHKFKADKDYLTIEINGKREVSRSLEITEVTENISSSGVEWSVCEDVYVWDTGHYVLPEKTIEISGKTYAFHQVSLTAIFPDEIKGGDIIESEVAFIDYPSERWKTIVITLVAIVLLAAIAWVGYKLFTRQKKKDKKPLKTPKQRAIEELEELQQHKKFDVSKSRIYYSQLISILKLYIENEFHVALRDKTTRETDFILIGTGMSKSTIDLFGALLDKADLVKFAASSITEEDIKQDIDLAVSIVLKISEDVQ